MDHPLIKIGGREFPVPPLALGQLKVIVPALLRLKKMDINDPSADNIDDLNEITYLAILRGMPAFPKADYMNLPGTVEDLLLAYPVIATQCGMLRKGGAPEGEQVAGPT